MKLRALSFLGNIGGMPCRKIPFVAWMLRLFLCGIAMPIPSQADWPAQRPNILFCVADRQILARKK